MGREREGQSVNEVTALGVIMLSTRVTNFLTKPPVAIIGNFPLRNQRDSP